MVTESNSTVLNIEKDNVVLILVLMDNGLGGVKHKKIVNKIKRS